MKVFGRFASIESRNVGQKLNLRWCPITVGAVDLTIDVAGVNEKYLIGAGGLLLPRSKNQSVQGKVTV